MRRNRVSACIFAVAASVAACTGTGDVEYAGAVHVSSPELIEISPGVHVIADADEPLFYSDGDYWLYRDGYWFRSDSYRGGFTRIDYSYVPQRIRVIERPQIYVQYRRHYRDRQARGTYQPSRSPPTYRQPAPSPQHPREHPAGVNPTLPEPPPPMATPPVTSPNDTHGTPMPPHHGGVGEDHAVPPGQQDRIPPGQQNRPPGADKHDKVPPPGQQQRVPPPAQARRAPGQQTRPQPPPRAGQPAKPHDRGPSVRPDDRGPQSPEHRPQARPEDRGPDRAKQKQKR